jgi:hypothetical protein
LDALIEQPTSDAAFADKLTEYIQQIQAQPEAALIAARSVDIASRKPRKRTRVTSSDSDDDDHNEDDLVSDTDDDSNRNNGNDSGDDGKSQNSRSSSRSGGHDNHDDGDDEDYKSDASYRSDSDDNVPLVHRRKMVCSKQSSHNKNKKIATSSTSSSSSSSSSNDGRVSPSRTVPKPVKSGVSSVPSRKRLSPTSQRGPKTPSSPTPTSSLTIMPSLEVDADAAPIIKIENGTNIHSTLTSMRPPSSTACNLSPLRRRVAHSPMSIPPPQYSKSMYHISLSPVVLF